MATTLNPYLHFRGTAREAMEHYAAVLGGELTLTTFREGGMPIAEEEADWVMHGQLVLPDGLVLMGSDTPSSMLHEPARGMTVALTGDDVDRLKGWWAQLMEGGSEDVPLRLAPWGDWFGQGTDRHGTPWMLNAGPGSA